MKRNSWKLYVDGAAIPNPGRGGVGIVIYKNEKLVFEKGYSIGQNRTNNQSEYFAVLVGLSLLSQKAQSTDKIIVYSDSQLVVNQLTKKWKVKNEKLKLIFDWINDYIVKYTNIKIIHISRKDNIKADFLANKAVYDKILRL